ncbi:MAG: hypothetical protein A2Z16_05910 [Chloroflexi bacterium RBG_16_54_18]|nr:MAG: hypothetical protein A2Z16_05910 [Chloroflexi bacterium RBG_16_54_18]
MPSDRSEVGCYKSWQRFATDFRILDGNEDYFLAVWNGSFNTNTTINVKVYKNKYFSSRMGEYYVFSNNTIINDTRRLGCRIDEQGILHS